MPITWLHFSDLHRGQPGDTRWAVSKQLLLEDIRSQAEKIGPPDLVLFTGDLAFAGRENDYHLVDDTLAEVYECVGHDVILIPVPGNHDLERPHRHELAALACKQYFEDADVRGGLLNAHKTTVDWLSSLFANYSVWWERSVLPRWKGRGLRFAPGLLPGDFVMTFEKDDLRLGIAGLNSAFLHFGDLDEEDLAVEYEQLGRVKELARWQVEHDATLLLMHHPREWLDKSSRRAFTDMIYPGNSFTACCFGHMHENVAETVTGGGSETRRWLQAASLFGLERYGKSNETRSVGYSWGRIERIDATNGVLSRWPRIGRPSEGGSLRIRDGEIDPYPHREKVQLRERKARRACRVSVVAVPEEFPFAQTTLLRRIEDLRPGLVCDFRSADDPSVPTDACELVVVIVGGLQGAGAILTDAIKNPDSLVAHSKTFEMKHVQRADWDPKALAALVSARADACVFASEEEILGFVRPALDRVCKEKLPIIQSQADDPFVTFVLAHLEARRQEAHTAFAEGEFERSRDIYQEIADRTSDLRKKEGVPPEVEKAWARSRLNLAACQLALRETEKAREILFSIDTDLLSDDARVVFATALVNVREMELAKRVASNLPADGGERIRQLIGVSVGQVPASKPEQSDQLVYAAQLLIKENRFSTALDWIVTALPGFANQTLGKLAALEALMHLLEAWAWAHDWSDALKREESATLLSRIELLLQELTAQKLAATHSRRVYELEYGLAIRTDDQDRASTVREHLAQIGAPVPELDRSFDTALSKGRGGDINGAFEALSDDDHPWRRRLRQIGILTLLGDHAAALDAALRLVVDFPNRVTTEYEAARQLLRAERIAEALPHAERAFSAVPGYGPRLLLADLLLREGREQDAVELAAPIADKGDAHALTLVAQGLEKSNPREALRRWREYDSKADDLQVKLRIAALELRAGRAADAAEHGWALLARPDAVDLTASTLYEIALLQAYGSPTNAHTRVTEIARQLRERVSNPADEALYFQLWAWLDAPTKLASPDFNRLAETGSIKPVAQRDLEQSLTNGLVLDSNVREAFRLGNIPFEAVIAELRWSPAHYVLSLGNDETLPAVSVADPDSHEAAPAIKRLLVSDVELLMCQKLALLDRLESALEAPAQVLMFEDVRGRLLHSLALMRLGAPRERQQESQKVVSALMNPAWVTSSGATSVDPSSDGPTVGQLIWWLRSAGAISHARAQSLIPSAESTEGAPWQPSGVVLVRSSVFRWLVSNELLEILVKAAQSPLRIPDYDREALRLEHQRATLEVEALDLSERVHDWLERRLEDGRACLVSRPEVDLPPAKAPGFAKARAWIKAALSVRVAADLNDAYALSVDTFTCDLFSGLYLPHILHSISWTQESYLAAKEKFSPLVSRIVGMGWLASKLQLDLSAREKIAVTGAIDTLDGRTFAELFKEYGAASLHLGQILNIVEIPLAEPRHSKSMAGCLLVGRAYASVVKLLLEEEGDSAARFAMFSLARLGAYSDRGTGAFLAFALPSVFDKPTAAYVPSSPGHYSPSPYSSAGQLFSSLVTWAQAQPSRLALLGRAAADTVVLLDQATSPDGPREIVVGALQLLAELMPGKDGADLTDELLGALATIGAVWSRSPLQTMGLTVRRQGESVGTETIDVVFEDVLRAGAALLPTAARPELSSLFAVWNHTVGEGELAVRVPVEAILLRAAPTIAAEIARELARRQGPNDGRMYSLLTRLAEQPEDRDIRHQLARRSIQSPWKHVLRDPTNIFLWARADGADVGAPVNLPSVLDLLSEPPEAGAPSDALSRLQHYLGGVWKERTDRRALSLLAANVPGAMGAQVARALTEDAELHTALRNLTHDRSVSSGDLWSSLTALWMAAAEDRKLTIKGTTRSARDELVSHVERIVSNVIADQERGTLEAEVLKQCRRVVTNFRAPPRDQVWLTYRLFGWLWVQLRSRNANGVRETLHQLATWKTVSHGDAVPSDPMDPLLWRSAHDLRLIAVMNVLALGDGLSSEEGVEKWLFPISPGLRANLIRVASMEIRDADRELRSFSDSEFRWLGTAMPQENALFLLLREGGGLMELSEDARQRWLQELPTGQPKHGIHETNLVGRLLVDAAAVAPLLSDVERTILTTRLRESTSEMLTAGPGQAVALLSMQRLGQVPAATVWPRIKGVVAAEGLGVAIAQLFAEALLRTNASDLRDRLLDLIDVIRGPSEKEILERVEMDPVFTSHPTLVDQIRARLGPSK